MSTSEQSALVWSLRYLSMNTGDLVGVSELEKLSTISFLPDFGYLFIDEAGDHFVVLYADEEWARYRFGTEIPEEVDLDELVTESNDVLVDWSIFCVDKVPGLLFSLLLLQFL
jgi:hypothetical protein